MKAVVEKGKWVVIDIAQIPLKSTKKFWVLAVWLYCLISLALPGMIRTAKRADTSIKSTSPIIYILLYLLSFYGCNAGQCFAFEVFQHGATTGGYIAYFVGKAKLVDSSN